MPSSTLQRTRRVLARDPVNELYDRACDLVAASDALRATAVRGGNDAAVAAVLHCLETALDDVGGAVGALGETSARRVAGAWPLLDDAGSRSRDVAARFADVRAMLDVAVRQSAELRADVGPLLAELSSV